MEVLILYRHAASIISSPRYALARVGPELGLCVLVPSDAGRAFLGGGNIGPLPHIPAVAAVAPFGRFIKCCSRYRAAIMETAVGNEQHHAV